MLYIFMMPSPLKRFIEIFSKFPAIGPRMATRFGFYLVNSGKNEISNLVQAIENLKTVKTCEKCFFVCFDQCPFCSDKNREQDIVAVLEKETDLLSLEKTGRFRGRYLVLGGLAKNGVLEPVQKLRLKRLIEDLKREFGGKAREIIIAFNPGAFGDFTGSLLEQELKSSAQKVTRLGRGVPTGAEIEFADEETLCSALEGRK